MKMTAEIKTDQRRVIDSPSRADVRNPVDRGEREVMVEAVETLLQEHSLVTSDYRSLAAALDVLSGRILQRVDVDVVRANELLSKLENVPRDLVADELVPKNVLGSLLQTIRALESQRPGMRNKDKEVGDLISQFQYIFDPIVLGHSRRK